MNHILELNDDSDNSNNENIYNNLHKDNNILEISVDYKFELMLMEMQNCLKDTVDVRNIVQKISTDRSDCFTSLFKPDIKKVDLMEEISRQKLNIEYLHHDKQVLINQVADLNNQLSSLKENNLKLTQELNMIKFKDGDRPMSSSYVTVETESSNDKTEIQRPDLAASFFRSISHKNSIKESNCKSNSWSELRTNSVNQDNSFLAMIPRYKRKNSENNLEVPRNNRFSGKNETKNCGDNKVAKTSPLSYKSNASSSLDIDDNINLSIDFQMWSTNQVCVFLNQIGLGAYVNGCKRWLINGLHLIESSKREIEKELNITNKLHLKKLLIHIRLLTSVHVPAATNFSLPRPDLKISSTFNTRLWLDDIGLLHYMGVFTENCFDGYMLDQISLADLQHLKIENELHSLSLKRGIEFLRKIDYNLSVFIRRPSGDTFNSFGSNENLDEKWHIPVDEICRWTQHQVSEWLRLIELPEYASNIRGSGIHGALFILEDRFNANSLASVLNIPRSRSLLRRHLQAKFHELIGSSLVAKKRAAAESPDFIVLSATSKIKFHRKKGIFDGMKRKHPHAQIEELLLPYTPNVEILGLKN